MHHSNLVFSTYCAETGTRMTVEVPARVARRYIERHKLLPDRLEQWPLSALEELLEEVDGGDVDAWERTLILLAHHRSVAAMLLLAELEAKTGCAGAASFALGMGDAPPASTVEEAARVWGASELDALRVGGLGVRRVP